MKEYTVLETILCKEDGCYNLDGSPWHSPDSYGARTEPYPNNFYDDEGNLYLGILQRVQFAQSSWGWVVVGQEIKQLSFLQEE
jgi:hypothetical protein